MHWESACNGRPITRKALAGTKMDARPEEEKQMEFIVRPFRRVVERGSAQPASDVRGTIHPEANVLVPPEAFLSVHFRSNGSVCGSGVLINSPYPPGAAAPEVKH